MKYGALCAIILVSVAIAVEFQWSTGAFGRSAARVQLFFGEIIALTNNLWKV